MPDWLLAVVMICLMTGMAAAAIFQFKRLGDDDDWLK